MLINANKLMGALDKLYAAGLFNSTDDYNMVIKEINKLPNELIRCSECKHYKCRCCHLFDGLTLPMADDFCSYAERKESK